jgi:hypothetical protein
MEREFNHKGHTYWVKVEPAISQTTGQTGFIAYVNNDRPGYLLYGEAVRDHNMRVIFFEDELSALTNANAVKQSEIDSRII